MPRKNLTRQARARRKYSVVEYTPPEYSADYEVMMTNGSAVKNIVITGSKVSARNRAVRIGLNVDDKTMPGTWWPINITYLGENSNMFTAL